MMTIARGIMESVNDGEGIQLVKSSFLKDEVRDDVERYQNYGFTSHPPANSEVIAVFPGGNRENGFIIACDSRANRKKSLTANQVAVYSADGTEILLANDGTIKNTAATKFDVAAPDSEFSGNVLIKGNLTVEGNILGEGDITALVKMITPLIQAGNFTGTGGGTMTSTVDMSTTGNVTGGGTDLATVKSTFNSHTHDENGTGGGTTDAPNSSV